MLVFPAERRKAGMSRDNLADPRWVWIKTAKHPPKKTPDPPAERLSVRDEDQVIDFHVLRQTCDAWLAKTGVHLKIVWEMRHATITLPYDHYSHWFEGQEADAAECEKMESPEAIDPSSKILSLTALRNDA